MSVLLDYGTDLNALTSSKGTPLHSLCYFANWDCFETILDYMDSHPDLKLDTTIRQNRGYMPIESAIYNDEHEFLSNLIKAEPRCRKHNLDGMIVADHSY
jgi:hypothetical protein